MSSPHPAVSTTFATLTGGTGMDGATVELAVVPPVAVVPEFATEAESGAAPAPAPLAPVVAVASVVAAAAAAVNGPAAPVGGGTAPDAGAVVPTDEPAGRASSGSAVTVRRGGLVDVNAVVRLLRAGAQDVDIDGDGDPDGPVDPEAARSAARMALSHVVLEDGELWVAHDAAGALVASSVWMPGSVEGSSTQLHGILERELHLHDPSAAIGPAEHVRPQLMEAMAGVLEHVTSLAPRLVLFAVTVSDEVAPADVVAVARAVVAPVLEQEGAVLAVALDGARARLLQAVGFVDAAEVPLGDLNTVWVGRA